MDEQYFEMQRRARMYLEREHDPVFREDVEQVIAADDREGLIDRFYQDLSFGTAGMRGIIGGGTNRVNPMTVSTVTEGLARYIKDAGGDLVVIAYDSRRYSQLFAQTAASVLCAHNIHVQMFPELRPVPMLSFAVRHLGACAGIVITASHNPAGYNGYKVYWSDGGQVTPPHDVSIVRRVKEVRAEHMEIPSLALEEAADAGLYSLVDSGVDEAYFTMVQSAAVRKHLFSEHPAVVVYTPLHGSGRMPVERILTDLHAQVITVVEQAEPDGNFPTVVNPNPEDHKAMALAVDLAIARKADLVLGTDPDGDRLGIAVPTDGGKREYRLLTGNQIAVLLADYILTARQVAGTPVTVKSLVTTDLVRKVTEARGGRCVDVLTGFKYIAEVMEQLEGSDDVFVLGAEESYGYLVETDVRDKDAVSAAVMAVEMACWEQSRDRTLLDRLEELWDEFGYHEERVLSRSLPGQLGQRQIVKLMEHFRSTVMDSLGPFEVTQRIDLLSKDSGFPKTNMLIYRLAGGGSFMLRPSGTEPKIKSYLFAVSKAGDPADRIRAAAEELDAMEVYFDQQLSLVREL